MAAEIAQQMKQKPTHVFLQAGVGGMAAAGGRYRLALIPAGQKARDALSPSTLYMP